MAVGFGGKAVEALIGGSVAAEGAILAAKDLHYLPTHRDIQAQINRHAPYGLEGGRMSVEGRDVLEILDEIGIQPSCVRQIDNG